MNHRKKLIEVALPLEAINEASAREKSIRHGHPSTLHLWWARRPLAAARAVIFTSLVDDPGHHPEDHAEPITAPPAFIAACQRLPKGRNATGVDEKGRSNDTPRMRLFDFIERLVTWEATTDEAILSTARELIRLSTDGNPPPLLDPFAGGGSIPLEAQRLGLEAHASDLNPVAVMINKALIEIPPKFANRPPVNPRDRAKVGGAGSWPGASGLAADVRYYGEWMRDRAWERIGHLYPDYNGETVIAWLWARTVQCPNPACGAQMPLVRSFDLSTKKGKRAWVVPHVHPQTREITFEVKQASSGKGPEGTVDRRGATCLACNTAVPFDHIREEGKAGRLGAQLMAIVTEGSSGKNYYGPAIHQEQAADVPVSDSAPDTDLPEQALGFRVQLYGMTKHRDLFTARQLVALTTFSDLLLSAHNQIRDDAIASDFCNDPTPLREQGDGALAYSEALSVYLSFVIGRYADYGSALTYWDNRGPSIQKTFGLPTMQMRWNFPETNPFGDFSGNWMKMLASVVGNIEMLGFTNSSGQARQQDASTIADLNLKLCLSTDPPYYDNIGYAALSDYFYIWLRRTLADVYPQLFATLLTPKAHEIIAEPARHESREAAAVFFEQELFNTFQSAFQIARSDYPMTVFYAFRQSETDMEGTTSTGWEVFLSGLIDAGFHLTSTWPLRTEQPGGLRLVGRNALASSILLTCRPRGSNAPITSRREFVNLLRQELPAALREMQSGNIAPVDLAQASIGPGMAVYSRYSKVLEPNGDRLTVRTALQLINQVLDEYLAEAEGDVDGDTRFAIAWFEQFGFNSGEFGTADVLARAKNTSVDGLVQAGVIQSGAGNVRLLTWEELDPGWDPTTDRRATVWEATHHLIERLSVHGEEGAALLLAKMPPDLAADARQLAYRLYAICERKGWSDHGRDYNALVISWAGSQERAAQAKQNYQQGRLFD